MATRKELRISDHFEVIDPSGVRHAITERTELHVDDAGREAQPRTKEYTIGDRSVVPMDGGVFEMLATGTRYRRLYYVGRDAESASRERGRGLALESQASKIEPG